MSVPDALVSELRSICGAEHVPTHRHQLRTYESDGLLQYAEVPGAVVLPASGAEVQRVVAALLDRNGLESRVDEDDQALWDGGRDAQRSSDGIVVRVSGVQDQTAALLERARELDARVPAWSTARRSASPGSR